MPKLEFLHAINVFIAEKILYLLMAVLLVNIIQRRHHKYAQKKRLATLYIGMLILGFMVGTVLIVYFELPDILVIPLAAALAGIGYRYRSKVFPFRLKCSRCGRSLSGKRILFFDSNTCEKCEPQ